MTAHPLPAPHQWTPEEHDRIRLLDDIGKVWAAVEEARYGREQALEHAAGKGRAALAGWWRERIEAAEADFRAVCQRLDAVLCEDLCGVYTVNSGDVAIAYTPCGIAQLCAECRYEHSRSCARPECLPDTDHRDDDFGGAA